MLQLVFHLLQAIELIIGQRVGRALKMGRAPCCDKSGLNKGPWRAEEDQKLIDYIQKHGHGSWRLVPKNAGLARCGKSCRLRWTNYLRPDIKRGRFSFEEEETIIQLHRMLGNKWSAIATHLPGRTDNEIKNYWNTHIRKRLTRMGINPVTHSSNLDLSPLFNPTLLSLCGLLGLQPMVNAELMKLAASLVSSQSQTSGLVNQNLFPVDAISPDNLQLFQTQQQLQDQNQKLIPPTCNTQNAQFPHEGQRPQQGILSANLWASEFNNHISDSYGDPMVEKGIASDHGNLESSSPILITGSVGSNYELQNSWNAASILSTPSSSSKNLNSPSTYMNNNSIEDERDSPCSNIFDFQIPDLLDVSDYL